jgi:hypothetical protein
MKMTSRFSVGDTVLYMDDNRITAGRVYRIITETTDDTSMFTGDPQVDGVGISVSYRLDDRDGAVRSERDLYFSVVNMIDDMIVELKAQQGYRFQNEHRDRAVAEWAELRAALATVEANRVVLRGIVDAGPLKPPQYTVEPSPDADPVTHTFARELTKAVDGMAARENPPAPFDGMPPNPDGAA